MVDRIGLPGSKIVVRADNGYEFSCECPVTDHKDAIKAILDYLSHRFLKNAAELSAVGHRMGHGGEYFDRSVIIDDDVMAKSMTRCRCCLCTGLRLCTALRR